MRIAVNTRLLLPGKLEGLGRYSYEILKRMVAEHPEHEFIFIFDRKPAKEFIFGPNVLPVVAHPQARHPILWYLFFEFGVARVLKKYKPDLFFSPDGWICLRTKVPSIHVVHDLNFFHNPSWVARFPRLYYQRFFPRFIKKAKQIITVSNYSRNDIENFCAEAKGKVEVVYNGVDADYKALDVKSIEQVKERYAFGQDYFLFVGLIHERKNLARIIEAFDSFKNRTQSPIKLLVVGSSKYLDKSTAIALKSAQFIHDIVMLGRLPQDELYAVMASSYALVYASLFEGFGIPVIEAMRCKVPVICSNITALPEVGGNAVLYVDPYSVSSIANAYDALVSNQNLREDYVKKGFCQQEKFDWDKAANATWHILERSLK